MPGSAGSGTLEVKEGVVNMTTLHAPEVGVRPDRPHVNLWLVAVIGLAVALMALGGWLIVDRYSGPEHDSTVLIDDIAAAWSAGDANAVTALYTTDAVIVEAWSNERTVGSSEIEVAVAGTARFGLVFERVAPVTTEDNFATTFIRYSDSAGEEGTLLRVFQLDEGKIARQWDFEIGVTSPFSPRAVIP